MVIVMVISVILNSSDNNSNSTNSITNSSNISNSNSSNTSSSSGRVIPNWCQSYHRAFRAGRPPVLLFCLVITLLECHTTRAGRRPHFVKKS